MHAVQGPVPRQVPSGGYRYFPLNTTIKPFDDLNVRKAVMAGFDRDAARKARGGKFVGDLATHFLPPDFPGFEEAGGVEGAGVDFLSTPTRRATSSVAAKYFKEAGFASGKYEGDEEILMVGANVDPGKAQAEVAKAQLEKLGFKVRLRLVPQDAVYTEWCQVPAKKVAHVRPAPAGSRTSPTRSRCSSRRSRARSSPRSGNINYSQLNDPEDRQGDGQGRAARGRRAPARPGPRSTR